MTRQLMLTRAGFLLLLAAATQSSGCFLVGVRQLPEEWGRAATQTQIAAVQTLSPVEDFDSEEFQLRAVGRVFEMLSWTRDGECRSTIYEHALDVSAAWSKGSWERGLTLASVGVGASWLYASLDLPTEGIADEDGAFALYSQCGLWYMHDNWCLGFEARRTLLGEFEFSSREFGADGYQVMLLLYWEPE